LLLIPASRISRMKISFQKKQAYSFCSCFSDFFKDDGCMTGYTIKEGVYFGMILS